MAGFENVKVGDTVVRMLAGTLPMKLPVSRGCYALASLISLAVMRIAKAMKWIPLRVLGSRS